MITTWHFGAYLEENLKHYLDFVPLVVYRASSPGRLDFYLRVITINLPVIPCNLFKHFLIMSKFFRWKIFCSNGTLKSAVKISGSTVYQIRKYSYLSLWRSHSQPFFYYFKFDIVTIFIDWSHCGSESRTSTFFNLSILVLVSLTKW